MLLINPSIVITVLCIVQHVYAVPVADSSQEAVGKKAGHCPDFLSDPEAIGQCSNQCIYDTDCENEKKCCLNACGGTSCVAPQKDPCQGYRCPKQGQVCVSLLTHAVCMCNTECPDIYQPVCDSNGNTFSNKCYMDGHACELDLTIEMVPCQTPESNEAPLSTDVPDVTDGEHEFGDSKEDWDTYSDTEGENEQDIVPPVTGVDDSPVGSTDVPVVMPDVGLMGDESDDEDEDDVGVEKPGAPMLNTPSGEVVAQEGEEAKIKCDVIGTPPPIIFWKRNEQTMYPGQTYGSISVTDQGVLQFSSSEKEHSGNYLCIAANTAGSIAALYALNVKDVSDEMPASNSLEDMVTDKPESIVEELLRPTMNPACRLPFEVGPCYHYEAVWFYNSETNICEVRSYGGCAGNINRFPNYEQCRAACPDMPENRCEHPIETGPCRGYFPRWGWVKGHQDCVQFTYGGCLGNDNNFDARDDCLAVCASNEVVTVTDAPEPDFKRADTADPNVDSIPTECEDCEPEKDLHESYCKNDFVLSGSVALMVRVDDNTLAVTMVIDGLYKHGGLQMTQSESVGMARLQVKFNGRCLCPNISTDGTRYIIMGKVADGTGTIDSSSYIRTFTTHRFTKLLHIKQNSVYICNPDINPYQ
ncbi:WAP, Kazal, immunoglobulin, Kunitz and NTR domain-containing protein 1-like [Glandiceps talaboti]